jgi:hypothetical protein
MTEIAITKETILDEVLIVVTLKKNYLKCDKNSISVTSAHGTLLGRECEIDSFH